MANANSTKYKTLYPLPIGNGSHSFVVSFTTDTAAMATNDTFGIIQLPAKGLTVVDAWLQMGDVDTNATPLAVVSLQVTNGTTTKTIIHQSSAGQAGGFVRPSKAASSEDGVGFTIDDDNYYLRLLYSTGAATAAAVACKVSITLSGFYESGAVTE